MSTLFIVLVSLIALISSPGLARAQTWNSIGLPRSAFEPSPSPSAPAPRRDLTGIWDAGFAGISGPGHVGAPFTPWAEERLKEMRPGNGPRAVTEDSDQRSAEYLVRSRPGSHGMCCTSCGPCSSCRRHVSY